jgi:VWFA-related protein
MRPCARRAIALPLLLLNVILLNVLPLAAQASAAPAFSDSIDVRVVNVEAVVTDRRGQRVPGLAVGDFRLLIDGRETPIDNFAEIGGAIPGPSAGAGGPAGAVEAAAAAPRGRSLVVFIDESFAVKAHRDMVIKKLAGQLGQLDPADRVAVVAFDGDRMSVLSDWTSDREALAAALGRAQGRPARGNAVVASRRVKQSDADFAALVYSVLNLADAGPGGGKLDLGGVRSDGSARTDSGGMPAAASDKGGPLEPVGTLIGGMMEEALSSRMARIPIAITAAMRAFANAPGRKLMLVLSGGWPSLSAVLPVAGEANRLGFTLYPVDVTGVDTTFLGNDVSYSGPSPVGQMKEGWELSAEYALEVMARATGGKASIDSNRLAALPRTLEDTRSYYWLSFTPHWTGDDRSHRIQLEVTRPGLEVRTRRSFADFSPATRARLSAEDVLFFGGDPASKQLGVLAGTAEKPSLRGQRIPFLLAIPLPVFTAGGEGQPFPDLVLSVQTEDDFGARMQFPDTRVHLSAASLAASQAGIAHFKVTLPLTLHGQRLIFTLRDPVSGALVWGETRVQP